MTALVAALIKGLGLTTGVAVVLSAVVGGVIALAKKVADKAIDARFETESNRLKAEQQVALENLKYGINASLSRISRLQQFEFDVLPQAWRLLHVAIGDLQEVVGRRLVRMSHLGSMSADARQEFVAGLNFSETHKREIIASSDPHDTYQALAPRYKRAGADKSYAEVHNYMVEKGIFIEPTLRGALKELLSDMRAVLVEYDLRLDLQGSFLRMSAEEIDELYAKTNAFNATLDARLQDMERSVAGRLWDVSVK